MKRSIILIGLLAVYLQIPADCHADHKNEFIKGYDYGRSFLKRSTWKGIKYRYGVQHMLELYGPWCLYYDRYGYIQCGRHIYLESRGNPWSHTKDVYLEEAGLTSVSWSTASRLHALGHGGDPCGDPRWSIAASAWRGREQRIAMLHGKKDPEDPNSESTFWASWLPDQIQDNRIEAEYFMSLCGGVNCQKVKRALKYADKAVRAKGAKPRLPEGVIENKHTWWKLLQWLRQRKPDYIQMLFDPLKISEWRFGSRWGRVPAGWNMIAEYWEPHPGGEPNYQWGDKSYWFPQKYGPYIEDIEIDDFPEPLYKMPKHSQWRKRCVLYGKKVWKQIWHEPKRNDRFKKTGWRDGKYQKAGQKKYKTDEEYHQAYELWKDDMQANGLLPTDEEYAWWEEELVKMGFQLSVTEEEFQDALEKHKKKKRKMK